MSDCLDGLLTAALGQPTTDGKCIKLSVHVKKATP